MYLAIALEEFGELPATGRRPAFHPDFHAGLIERAEQAAIDFVTLDVWPGRMDTTVLAAVAAQRTTHIGLVLTGFTKGDPADVAARIATLDHLSGGRTGWRPRVAATPEDRVRPMGTPEWHRRAVELFGEAAEFAKAVKQQWRDWRIPRPVVAALAHSEVPLRFASEHADVVFVTPKTTDEVIRFTGKAKSARVFADLTVFLSGTTESESDAAVFTGTPENLADRLAEWQHVDGFRLRPGVLPDDLDAIVDGVVPLLQKRGLFRTDYTMATLRGHLGLS